MRERISIGVEYDVIHPTDCSDESNGRVVVVRESEKSFRVKVLSGLTRYTAYNGEFNVGKGSPFSEQMFANSFSVEPPQLSYQELFND